MFMITVLWKLVAYNHLKRKCRSYFIFYFVFCSLLRMSFFFCVFSSLSVCADKKNYFATSKTVNLWCCVIYEHIITVILQMIIMYSCMLSCHLRTLFRPPIIKDHEWDTITWSKVCFKSPINIWYPYHW